MTTANASAHNAPVHPLSAASLALADWLATGLNIVTYMDAYWPVAVGSALLGALAIMLVERKLSDASWRVALIKGGCALPLIALPFPFAGSLVALAFLAWWMVAFLVHRRRGRHPGALA
jgi:hypothetical protein